MSEGLFENAEVISVYTRKQALEDGFLIDLMQDTMKEVCEQHYKYPIACTSGVWAIIDKAVKNKKYFNDYAGVVHDVLWMSRVNNRKLSESTIVFFVIITGAGRTKNHTFILNVGPGDNAEPVITIMLPGED